VVTTDRKMRPRRGSRFDAVPPELAAWFRGECDFCWYVVLTSRGHVAAITLAKLEA